MVDGEVVIWSQATGVMATINHLRNYEGYNWCSELPLTTNVQIYGAVVASDENLEILLLFFIKKRRQASFV